MEITVSPGIYKIVAFNFRTVVVIWKETCTNFENFIKLTLSCATSTISCATVLP